MNLEYMKVSLFEISEKTKELFHDIQIFWDAPVIPMHVLILPLTVFDHMWQMAQTSKTAFLKGTLVLNTPQNQWSAAALSLTFCHTGRVSSTKEISS